MSGPVLTASGLVKRFGGFVAVDGVDLRLAEREVTALIGPNGAGKTTVFNLITGQLQPDAGSVHAGEADITGRPPHRIARLGIGRTFQDVRLFGQLTVRDNIAVYAQASSTASLPATLLRPRRQRSLDREARATADRVLEYLAIAQLADVTAADLGFAQQKLVAIGRLLALGARTLFLDEPASGLDHAGRETLAATIRQLADDGYTVCFVEHNTDMVRELASRVVFLAEGRIIADGAPGAVFEDADLAEVYFGVD